MLHEGERFEIGRGRNVDIRLKGLAISRRHAAFELTMEGVTVEDLGSRNGTQLGERRLDTRIKTLIPANQPVTIGPYTVDVTEFGGMESNAEARRREVQDLLEDDAIEVRYLVGKGASGSVWAGWQASLNRMVAIKILPQGVTDEEEQQRFMREGQVVGRIHSPHVVSLYDFRIQNGRPYLLLELVSGLSAMERLREGPLPISDALEIGEHVARALVALQEQDVIHRDVKPSNILLSADGIAKLSDFGIAKDLHSDAGLTQKGTGLGTFSYMAPEQFEEARSVTAAADIYGLGATLYHLIAGRPAFIYSHGVNPTLLVREILTKSPPPLRDLRKDCPGEVADFVRRMLSKDPAARPGPAEFVETMLRKLRRYHCARDTRRVLWESSTDTCVD
jgi:hypothetical protein